MKIKNIEIGDILVSKQKESLGQIVLVTAMKLNIEGISFQVDFDKESDCMRVFANENKDFEIICNLMGNKWN